MSEDTSALPSASIRRTDQDVPFEITEFHHPEPHLYAFSMDATAYTPEGMHVMKFLLNSVELISSDGQRTLELVKEGLRFCVYRAGKGRLEYSNEINGKVAELTMVADFTLPPQLQFTMAIFNQPVDIGAYRLNAVRGYLTFSVFENTHG